MHNLYLIIRHHSDWKNDEEKDVEHAMHHPQEITATFGHTVKDVNNQTK